MVKSKDKMNAESVCTLNEKITFRVTAAAAAAAVVVAMRE